MLLWYLQVVKRQVDIERAPMRVGRIIRNQRRNKAANDEYVLPILPEYTAEFQDDGLTCRELLFCITACSGKHLLLSSPRFSDC